MKIDLRANPFYLTEEDCNWVHETIAAMSDEEKVGQLFFQLTSSQKEEDLVELVETYHLGGCRYNPAKARDTVPDLCIMPTETTSPAAENPIS